MTAAEQANRTFDYIRCVFLDRDGVINRKAPEGKYISRWEEFEILPGVEEAVAELNRRGQRVLVISNQRGIALNLYSADDVDRLHGRLQAHLAERGAHIDGFFYCPHDSGECACRKPGIALLQQALETSPGIAPAECVMIGDSLSDIQAASAFGCASVFVEGDPETQKSGSARAALLAGAVAASLHDAVMRVLR